MHVHASVHVCGTVHERTCSGVVRASGRLGVHVSPPFVAFLPLELRLECRDSRGGSARAASVSGEGEGSASNSASGRPPQEMELRRKEKPQDARWDVRGFRIMRHSLLPVSRLLLAPLALAAKSSAPPCLNRAAAPNEIHRNFPPQHDLSQDREKMLQMQQLYEKYGSTTTQPKGKESGSLWPGHLFGTRTCDSRAVLPAQFRFCRHLHSLPKAMQPIMKYGGSCSKRRRSVEDGVEAFPSNLDTQDSPAVSSNLAV